MRMSDLAIVTMLNSGGDMSQSIEMLEQPEVMGVLYKDDVLTDADSYALVNVHAGRSNTAEGRWRPCGRPLTCCHPPREL